MAFPTKREKVWERWLVSMSRFDEDTVAHAMAHGGEVLSGRRAGGRAYPLPHHQRAVR